MDQLLGGKDKVRILEAGAGSKSHFRHKPDSHIVGVDISQEQLDRSTYLHEKILGDIQEHGLPKSAFDLIICWDVLEHLDKPIHAVENFADAVCDGGLIFIAMPNILTVRGLLTKAAPHWLKVLYYRYVVGLPEAGEPGHYPFKAFHRIAISAPSIVQFASEHNLSVARLKYTTWDHSEYHYRIFMLFWVPLNAIVKALTFGVIGTDDKQGVQILLQKHAPAGAPREVRTLTPR